MTCDLPENEVLHIIHSRGKEAAVLIREGDDIVMRSPDRSRVIRRKPIAEADAEHLAWLAASLRSLRDAS